VRLSRALGHELTRLVRTETASAARQQEQGVADLFKAYTGQEEQVVMMYCYADLSSTTETRPK
jgi:hypothetical protein